MDTSGIEWCMDPLKEYREELSHDLPVPEILHLRRIAEFTGAKMYDAESVDDLTPAQIGECIHVMDMEALIAQEKSGKG
jgi:hypothetical protein